MVHNRSPSDIVTDYDIMIVGGGPAGTSTWLHLHKYAPDLVERTILIDKETFPRDKICGGGLGGWSEYILSDLEIDIDIPSLLVSDLEIRYMEKSKILHEKNCFRMIRRKEFDNLLVKNALKRGLHLHQNEEFIDIQYKDKSVIVETNKNKYLVKSLIGADGSLSAVRRKMNLSNKPHLAPTLEIFAPVNCKYDLEYEQKKITLDFTPIDQGIQGYIWHLPHIINDHPYMSHGIADLQFQKVKKQTSMKELFAKELKKRNLKIEQKKWLSHPIRCFSEINEISKPNILLVGDAAGIEPVTGGGIHFALSYGKVAAKTLNFAFDTNNFTFKDYRHNFQSTLAGKYMKKCIYLAKKMYIENESPITIAKKVFSKNS